MRNKISTLFFLILLICSCKENPEVDETDGYLVTSTAETATIEEVQITGNVVSFNEDDGVKKIPVWVNGVGLEFIFDTGAADTVISAKEVMYLVSKGEIKTSDIIGIENYQVASGENIVGLKIRLNDIKVGTKTIYDVEATIFKELGAPLLLGQSVLNQFGSYTVNNDEKTITFSDN